MSGELLKRGWRRERVVRTVDTTSQEVTVATGVTTDQDGRLVAVIAIGDGPSAVMLRSLNEDIAEAFQSLEDAQQAGQ